jgi:hypothetical protein
MSHHPEYVPGDFWRVCDRCGFDYRRSETRKEWTGLIVCRECWDPKPVWTASPTDKQAVDNPRPVQPEKFLAIGDVKPEDL